MAMKKRWRVWVVWPDSCEQPCVMAYWTRRRAERAMRAMDSYRVLTGGKWRYEVRRV